MSTTLAEQLQKLAVPQTSILERDKKRASLLFDPKEAASINRNTFYDIGISGLHELISLNDDFTQFKKNLFSMTSRNIERAVQDKATNFKLNKTIKKFFMLLSPYFLLKPAHKALEWLVHRFLIQEYNKDDFLKLILPYHETNIFVRCLQICNFKNKSDNWHWLLPVRKSGAHLPKIILYNHCASDVGFLKFVGKMVIEAVDENGKKSNSLATLFNFYCTTIVGACENLQVISESHLTAILPCLLKGLTSEFPDYKAAAFIITAQILKKTKLSHKILDVLVQRISKNEQNNLKMEATLLLVVVYQSQRDNYTTVSDKAMKNLAKADWFPVNLGILAAEGSFVLPILVPVLRSALTKIKSEEYRLLVEKLFEEVRLDEDSMDNLIRLFLDYCPKSPEDDSFEKSSEDEEETQSKIPTVEWYANFLKRLETQHPNSFDRIIRHITSKSGQNSAVAHHKTSLQHIMNFMMAKGESKNSCTIFEKLFHPNASFRVAAVDFLVKNFKNLSEKDLEMLKNAVSERILDDDPRVVKAILKLQKNDLEKLLSENQFVELVVKLLIKIVEKPNFFEVMNALIKHICVENETVFINLLPFLFPINETELEIALQISKTDFCKKILKNLKFTRSPSKFCSMVYQNILNCEINFKLENLTTKLPIHKYISCVLYANNFVRTQNLTALENIEKYLPQAKLIENEKSTDFDLFTCIISAKNRDLPLEGLLELLKVVIKKSESFQLSNNWLDFSTPNKSVDFLINMLVTLVKGCSSDNKIIVEYYSSLLKMFMDKFFSNLDQRIQFLSNVITFDSETIDLKNQLRIIQILSVLLSKSKNVNSNHLIPASLIGLINPVAEIRMATFEVISYAVKNKIANNALLKKVLEHKDEIILDSEQLPLILYNLSTESNEIRKIINKLFNITIDAPLHIVSKLLNVLTFINSGEIFETTCKLALNILQPDNLTLTSHKSSIIYNILLRLNKNIASEIKLDYFSWTFISSALKQDKIILEYLPDKFSSLSVLILNQIDREIFKSFNEDLQNSLVENFVTIATCTENPETCSAVYKVVKRIDLDAKLLINLLTIMKDLKSNKILPQRKFRRISEIPSADILDMTEWKKGITVLEFIQDKKKLTNSQLLLPLLFGILKKCLDFDEQAAVEYPKQIILSAILHICKKLETENANLSETVFNMELIVQCIRASQNPQTHHHALLVLAYSSNLFPEQVLHNIMAIFTFMGSSVLRHDDAYSFQIISKIIDTVIPILVQKNGDVTTVLRVFVDVILDIPEHRRDIMFNKLLVTLGVEKHLWLFLILIFESHVLHGKESKEKNIKFAVESIPKRLEIAAVISLEFSPSIIISTTIKLLEFLKQLPIEQDENFSGNLIFDVKKHTPKQFRHFKYILISFLSKLLSAQQLVNKIAVLENAEILALEPAYKEMLISILTYIQSTTKIVDRMVNTNQASYWKVVLHHCYDVMDGINALLTTDMFLLVIRGLIVHNISTIKRKAMEILNSKLQQHPSFFYSNVQDTEITEPEGLFLLIPSLLNIIKTLDQKDVEPEQELTQQTALLSLKLLVKNLAAKNPENFIPILNFITDLIKSKKLSDNILASVMLCLAELCSKLKAHAISGLVKYMPAIIKILRTQKHQETPGLLLMCIITAIQKIVESLPLFLSPYLEKLLCELTVLSGKWCDVDHNLKLAPFVKKLSSIRSYIGSTIPSRILIPIVTQTYENLLENKHFSAIGPLMNILTENLSKLTVSDLNNHMSDLTSFFLIALQFRTISSLQPDEITKIEDEIIKTLTVLVLKLSESSFRPFYYRLYDWAVRSEVKSKKVITFYRLSCKFAESLKGLFVLFAGHFIKNAADLLDSCNSIKNEQLYFEDEHQNVLLITSILETLRLVFLYDSQNFINKERFEILLQPIVDQLENLTSNSDKNILIPCISQFAAATADDSLWKQLNYQILLKTRHNLSTVRIIAVDCVCEVARKLGEDFLPLLPETIPFLAELLEDEEEVVEVECRKVVQELEIILGEQLQKYF